ncbi:MAG: hypothetical protein ACMUIG_01625 [Thermoplasmatota archaeon]
MMEAVYEFDDRRKILIIRVLGKMTVEEISPVTMDARKKAKDLNYGLLYDFRGSSYRKAIIEAYKWFEEHFDLDDPKVNFVPTANIINEEDEEFFKFIETTMYNRGARLRYFLDEEQAVRWLESIRNDEM